ncbi:hypothetical protein AVEN_172465-1 [Araneus ventricosus]|uniref:Uncharacterized protein n=1 Tax=Araneus ventricosus TaxID=182803 RepID=A0A4Y2DXJ0_ARAVE|nr:hypothetical protein AVEN_172465-1 [Araneus ventricosus]
MPALLPCRYSTGARCMRFSSNQKAREDSKSPPGEQHTPMALSQTSSSGGAVEYQQMAKRSKSVHCLPVPVYANMILQTLKAIYQRFPISGSLTPEFFATTSLIDFRRALSCCLTSSPISKTPLIFFSPEFEPPGQEFGRS